MFDLVWSCASFGIATDHVKELISAPVISVWGVSMRQAEFRELPPIGMYRASVAGEPPYPEILGQFLCNTLVRKLALHERGGSAYQSIRRWRAPIKLYQVEALAALKRSPSAAIVDSIAREFVAAIACLIGSRGLANVVPIPSGSSGKLDSLSVQVAVHLAAKIDAKFVDALVQPHKTRRGRSHPKKSALLKPYSLTHSLSGLTVLVDDVATSGRHLELGLAALRDAGVPAIGLVWIGP